MTSNPKAAPAKGSRRPKPKREQGNGQEPPKEEAKAQPAQETRPDGWPRGYNRDAAGVYFTPTGQDGEPDTEKKTRLGPWLDVLGQARNSQGEAWGNLIKFHDPDGNEHIFVLGLALFAGEYAAWLKELYDRGYKASYNKKARGYLAEFFSRCYPKARIRLVSKTGWVDGGLTYVLLDETITGQDGADGREAEKYLLSPKPAKDIFAKGGSFAGWKKTVGRWAIGNSLLFFAVCAGLSGPLLKLLGQESGGVHLYGPTSSGKSTCLSASASVWGRPDEFSISWRNTDNAIEGAAALHCDTLLALDEIGMAPERTLKEAAYLLANEIGKGRARRDGSARPPSRWRIFIFSTGEVSFSISLKQGGVPIKAGQAVRMIDLPADGGAGLGCFQVLHGFPTPAALAEAIKTAAKENHGWAGPGLLRRLLALPDPVKSVRDVFEKMRRGLTPPEAAPEIARAVQRFALVATAGELAARFGFFEGLGPDGGEALLAVKFCLDAWLNARGGAGSLDAVEAEARLDSFLETEAARFQPLDSSEPPPRRAGFRDRSAFHIFQATFKDEICKGLNHTEVARVLAGLGRLRFNEKYFTNKITLPLLGRKKVYSAVEREPEEATREDKKNLLL